MTSLIKDGVLAPCPDKPNCVSSQAPDRSHFIEPIRYSGDARAARRKLIQVLKRMSGTRIVLDEKDVIQVEFRTSLLRFVDDGVFWFDDGRKVIHVRSASRIGYSDLGTNRRRIENIRQLFAE